MGQAKGAGAMADATSPQVETGLLSHWPADGSGNFSIAARFQFLCFIFRSHHRRCHRSKSSTIDHRPSTYQPPCRLPLPSARPMLRGRGVRKGRRCFFRWTLTREMLRSVCCAVLCCAVLCCAVLCCAAHVRFIPLFLLRVIALSSFYPSSLVDASLSSFPCDHILFHLVPSPDRTASRS